MGEIRSTLASMAKVFEQDGEEVQREWVRFTAKVDKKLEEALRHTVKRSLQVSRGGGWQWVARQAAPPPACQCMHILRPPPTHVHACA